MKASKGMLIAAIGLFCLGVFSILSSYQLEIWARIPWDIRAVGLGTGFISISVGFLALYVSRISDRRMKAMANLEFYEKIAVVENYIAAVKSRTPVVAKSIKHDLIAAKQLNNYVDSKIKNALDEKIDELKKEANIDSQKYTDLIEELTNLLGR